MIAITPSIADSKQRDRSRSPRRRSRSPRRTRRSYSPRSRSRSRGDDYHRSERRSRSPMSGAPNASGGYSGSGYAGSRGGGPPRSFEDRAAAKEQMMQSVRDSSQQDRRVYVGNLAYDVKWHHLKDFMRQGSYHLPFTLGLVTDVGYSWRSSLCRCLITSEWNVEGGRHCVMRLVSLVFLFLVVFFLLDVGLTGWTWSTGLCRDAGKSQPFLSGDRSYLTCRRIVEYATREQAQQAIQTLSNQSLMGRLVYVREVRSPPAGFSLC